MLTIFMIVNESAVFTVDPTTSFLSVFGDDHMSNPDDSLRVTAKQVSFFVGVLSGKIKHVLIFFKQLLSVCATLGEDPIIRYQTQSEGGIHPQGSPAGKLAHIVQKEVDNFCRLNPNFPVSIFFIGGKERDIPNTQWEASSSTTSTKSNAIDS